MSPRVHGVVRAGHPVTAARVRLVDWQDLAAVVSDDAPDPLAHLEMLSALVPAGPVVPLRFGTTAVDDDAVRDDVLARSAPRLRVLLDRLDGAVEVHAYLRFDENAALQAVYDRHHAGWRTGGHLDLSARIRLGEQVAHHLVAWRRARADELLAPVAAVAREHVALADREHTEERHAFLVPTGEVGAVRAAIAGLSDPGADAECVGPLPAYSFLDEPAATRATAGQAPASRWGW